MVLQTAPTPRHRRRVDEPLLTGRSHSRGQRRYPRGVASTAKQWCVSPDDRVHLEPH
jgi:hypothetical protein